MNRISPFFAGLLFGLGLYLSGMTDPQKVLGFLDLEGAWDPSPLALVMIGAIAVAFVAFRVASRQAASLSGRPFQLPTSQAIDARLIGGSLLFGAGWGLPAYVPGRRSSTWAISIHAPRSSSPWRPAWRSTRRWRSQLRGPSRRRSRTGDRALFPARRAKVRPMRIA